MRTFMLSLVRLSPTRSLVAFAVFCACFFFSCAVGEEGDVSTDAATSADSKVDAEIKAPPTFDVPRSNTANIFDAPPAHDEDHLVIMSHDGTTVMDVRPDWSDIASDHASVDVATEPPVDVSLSFPMQDASIIDALTSTPSDSSSPDVTSPPDILLADTSTPTVDAPSHPLEQCNGRDDDGNGFIDELFECSVGRRGDTCVTSCGANGYRLCDSTCRWNLVCTRYPEDCGDTIDNDCNGQIDCADAACTATALCRPLSPVDAGPPTSDVTSMPLCHTLIIQQRPSAMPLCRTGWIYILYDFDGHPHESAPSDSLTYIICGRLQGQLVVSARCDGEYLLDWPGTAGTPVNRSGVASITLDGVELADTEALLCLDRWSRTPGIRPVIPLEPYFYGRCP